MARPSPARALARFVAIVVLPQPPFRLITVIRCIISLPGGTHFLPESYLAIPTHAMNITSVAHSAKEKHESERNRNQIETSFTYETGVIKGQSVKNSNISADCDQPLLYLKNL